jgi:hypothetical protein
MRLPNTIKLPKIAVVPAIQAEINQSIASSTVKEAEPGTLAEKRVCLLAKATWTELTLILTLAVQESSACILLSVPIQCN